MKLIINHKPLLLLPHEYLEHHEGREGHPFSLDTSICGIKTESRAEELKDKLTSLYPFAWYKMETPRLIERTSELYEVSFCIGDFRPLIVS